VIGSDVRIGHAPDIAGRRALTSSSRGYCPGACGNRNTRPKRGTTSNAGTADFEGGEIIDIYYRKTFEALGKPGFG
jgi:hypothetical protein